LDGDELAAQRGTWAVIGWWRAPLWHQDKGKVSQDNIYIPAHSG